MVRQRLSLASLVQLHHTRLLRKRLTLEEVRIQLLANRNEMTNK